MQKIHLNIKSKNPEKFDTSQGFLGLQPYRLGFCSYELAVWTGLTVAFLYISLSGN